MARLWGWKDNLRILLRRPGVFIRKYRWPLGLLLLGGVLDAVTTVELLSVWGPEAELHPCGRWLARWFGVAAGISVGKTVQMAFAVFVAALWRRWCGWFMALCGVLYALAAASNHFGWL
jgi:hypothetical protein